MSDLFSQAELEAARMQTEADAVVAQLINMGATRVEITERTPDREVRIEHPELPGVLIKPVSGALKEAVSEGTVGNYLIVELARALAEERNIPHGD